MGIYSVKWALDLFPSPGNIHVDGHLHAVQSDCKLHRPARASPTCGGAALFGRSYTLPARWPFPPFHLVMEAVAGACDLYKHRQACCAVASHFSDYFIESEVRDVLASFLSGCQLRLQSNKPCLSLDLGANQGWMSAYMALLGSFVVAVEPAVDLADAIKATALLNCWDSRMKVVQGFACARQNARIAWCPGKNGSSAAGGHRAGGTPVGLRARQPYAYKVRLDDLLFKVRPSGWPSSSAPPHFDMIKMDGDGPEGVWLVDLSHLIASRRISVQTITFEANGIRPATMARFQSKLGYDCYRLDFADNRRFMTARGWDAYSPNGTMGAIDRHGGAWERDALEEEWFMVRSMRRLFFVKPNLTEAQWEVMLHGRERAFTRRNEAMQFVLTRERGLLIH